MPSYRCENGHTWVVNDAEADLPACPFCGAGFGPTEPTVGAVDDGAPKISESAETWVGLPASSGDSTETGTVEEGSIDMVAETVVAPAPTLPSATDIDRDDQGGETLPSMFSPTVPGSRWPDQDVRGVEPPTIEQFLENASAAGLNRESADGDWTTILGEGRPFDDGLAFGRELVSRGRLTEYQLRTLCRSNGDPLVIGSYELLDPLGAGGMGTVFRARDRRLGRIVAVKILALHLANDPDALQRFEIEGRATAKLEHEHIVTVFDVGTDRGRHFLAMRFVDGKSLADLLRDGPLEPRKAAGLLSDVAGAVQAAHDGGVLHRDLKPHNVLVEGATGRALVADFGLAKLVEADEHLTRTGEVMGTPAYMAPEQAKDSGDVTTATDVYAIGATLYYVLTGRAPYSAATPLMTLQLVIDADPVAPRRLNPSVDRDLETICLRCLEKDPRSRYESAADVQAELRRFLAGEPILARPIGPFARFTRWCNRNRRLAVAGGVAIVGVLAALVATTIGYITTSAARQRAEEGYREARSAVHGFFTEVADEELLDQPGLQPLRERLLRRALAHYERFLDERGNDPALREEIADVHDRVGLVLEEIDGPEAALVHYRQALPTRQSIAAAATGDDLADAERMLGVTQNAIGRAEAKAGHWSAAIEAYEAALETRTELVERFPEDAECVRGCANTLMNLAIARRRNESADFAETRDTMERAIEMRVVELGRQADNRRLRRDLAKAYFNLGKLELTHGETSAAHQAFLSAEEEFQRVAEEDARDLRSRLQLVLATRLATTFEEDPDVARAALERAHADVERLARENPDVTEFRLEFARVQLDYGELLSRQREFEEASRHLGEAIRTLESLVESEEPAETSWEIRRDFAVTLRAAAVADFFLNRRDDARERLLGARGMLEALVAEGHDGERVTSALDEVRQLLAGLDAVEEQETTPRDSEPSS